LITKKLDYLKKNPWRTRYYHNQPTNHTHTQLVGLPRPNLADRRQKATQEEERYEIQILPKLPQTTNANKKIINNKERKPRHDTLKITVPRASTHPYPMNLYFTYYLLLSACFSSSSFPLLFSSFLGLSVLLSF